MREPHGASGVLALGHVDAMRAVALVEVGTLTTIREVTHLGYRFPPNIRQPHHVRRTIASRRVVGEARDAARFGRVEPVRATVREKPRGDVKLRNDRKKAASAA